MKISIFGLGYVGAVSLASLARDGHRVIVHAELRPLLKARHRLIDLAPMAGPVDLPCRYHGLAW